MKQLNECLDSARVFFLIGVQSASDGCNFAFVHGVFLQGFRQLHESRKAICNSDGCAGNTPRCVGHTSGCLTTYVETSFTS